MLRISVIVPVYNTPNSLLKRCLISLSAQTYPYEKLVLVDDGSCKKTANFLDEMSTTIENCKVIHTENYGVSSARNTGVKEIDCEYVMFVDADDVVSPYMLEEAAKIAEITKADIVYGRIADVKENADIIFPEYKEKVKYEIIDTELKKKKLIKQLIFMTEKKYCTKGARLSHGPFARLIKYSLVMKTPFRKNARVGEDEVWNLQLAKRAKKIVISESCWYYYVEYANSAMHRFWAEGPDDFIQWSENLHEIINEKEFEVPLKEKDIDIVMYIMNGYYAHESYPYCELRANREFRKFIKVNSNILNCNIGLIKKMRIKSIIKWINFKYNLFPVSGYKILKKAKNVGEKIKCH